MDQDAAAATVAATTTAADDAARITRDRSSLQQFRTASTASGLLPAEDRLLIAAVSGQDCVLGNGSRPQAPDESLRVRASFLRFLALGGDDAVRVHERGIVLVGAYVEGKLFLAGAHCTMALQFKKCFFDDTLALEYAHLLMILLDGSRVAGISGDLVQVDGHVLLQNGFLATGPVRFYGGRIEGDLDCRGATLQIDQPVPGAGPAGALICTNTTIRGDLNLSKSGEHGFHAKGQVRLVNAKIGGRLDADGARLDCKDNAALLANAATIGGAVSLQDVRITGRLEFRQATIGGALTLTTTEREDPVSFEPADMTGPDVWQGIGFDDFQQAAAAGKIAVSRRAIHPPAPAASPEAGFTGLVAPGLTVKASVRLKGVFAGPVNLDRAHIGGDLDCRGCLIDGGQWNALSCGDADITGTVLLQPLPGMLRNGHYIASDLFEARGGVNLSGTKIGGNLVCAGGSFVGGAPGGALHCSNCRIGGDANLAAAWLDTPWDRDPAGLPEWLAEAAPNSLAAAFMGPVYFYASTIGGNLDCSGSFFHAPGTAALDCRTADVGGSVFLGRTVQKLDGTGRTFVQLSDAFRSTGEVSLAFATIGLRLECPGGRFENADGSALDVSTAQIKGGVGLGCWFMDAYGLAFRFVSQGVVAVSEAKITGDLDCSGGRFVNAGQLALVASNVQVSGNANFQQVAQNGRFGPRCETSGRIDLIAAHICGYLQFIGGSFANPGGTALGCSGIKVEGAVFLSRLPLQDAASAGSPAPSLQWLVPAGQPAPFQSDGIVDFKYAQTAYPLLCQGGHFRNRGADKTTRTQAELALDLRGARIGSLEFGIALPGTSPAIMEGSCNLAGAHAVQFIDTGFAGNASVFPEKVPSDDEPGKQLDCVLTLDGFTYERFGWESPTTAQVRKAWLSRQPLAHLSEKTFRPQPFDQLARVLRAMGQEDEATAIAVYKEQRKTDLLPLRGRIVAVLLVVVMFGAALVARDVIDTTFLSRGIAALLGWAIALACLSVLYFMGGLAWLGRTSLRLLADYGYKPSRILFIALVFGFGVGLVLGQAAEQGVVVPQPTRGEQLPKGCGPDWTACDARPFTPIVYSFDTMLPLKLGVADKWSVDPRPFQFDIVGWHATWPPWALQWLLWLEIVFGWVASGIVLALVSGMLKKD
ncbi:MAG TPA: hypothetical protein VJY39_23095 [Acidisphaera sp.]|nr:hypothetical protein [Acidisphaera sp.]